MTTTAMTNSFIRMIYLLFKFKTLKALNSRELAKIIILRGAKLINREILNAGVNGDTSGGALRRLERDVLQKDPFLVIVALGGNDFLRRISFDKTVKNMETIITRIHNAGAAVALCDISSGLVMSGYRKQFKRLAKKSGAIFIEGFYANILNNPDLKADGILIHMLLGKLKAGDIPADVRDDCIRKMVELYFEPNTVLVTGYGFDMLYAGPREALLHAVFRQNTGCTHLIVGRDHAGVGDYYGPFDAQTIFDEIPEGALELKIYAADQKCVRSRRNMESWQGVTLTYQQSTYTVITGNGKKGLSL